MASYGTFSGSLRNGTLLVQSKRKIVIALASLAMSMVISSALIVSMYQDEFTILEQQQQQQPPVDPNIQAFVSWLPHEVSALIDTATDPCVDFHQFACGTWEKNAVIPGDKTSLSYSWELADDRRQDELQKAMQIDDGLVGNYYKACFDVAVVNSLGVKPALPWLKLIDSAVDVKSFATVVGKLHEINMDIFFSWFVGTDHVDPTLPLMYITNGGLNLPDKAYYTDTTAEYEQHRVAYCKFLEAGMVQLGFSTLEAAQIANDTMEIEHYLASNEDDADDMYKLSDVPPRFNNAGLRAKIPAFDWATYFTTWGKPDVGSDKDILSTTRPKWFAAFNTMLTTKPLDKLRNYMKAHSLYYFAPMLSETMLNLLHNLDKDLYGLEQLPTREKKCVGATKHALPLAVGKTFIEHFVAPNVKPRATSMMEEIRTSFSSNLDTVEWMSPQVRSLAKVKLNGIFFEVAYPDVWPDYTFVTRNDSYFENAMQAFTWTTHDQFNHLFKPVNRREWDSSPAAINAFYSNGVNGVFIPAGILQNPFFDGTFSDAQNYGSMGAIMGHELTHGFDNTGRKYDAIGARHQWWDNSTVDQYKSRADCISQLFDSYVVAGVHVHGNDTLGEDIADLGGLKVAYHALLARNNQTSVNDRKLFWTSFAQSWCAVEREKATKLQVLTDAHAPDKFRILGPLSQLAEFSQDFQCKPGSFMNPKDKCVLW